MGQVRPAAHIKSIYHRQDANGPDYEGTHHGEMSLISAARREEETQIIDERTINHTFLHTERRLEDPVGREKSDN